MNRNVRRLWERLTTPLAGRLDPEAQAQAWLDGLELEWAATVDLRAADQPPLTLLILLEGDTPDAFDATDRAKIAAFNQRFGVDLLPACSFSARDRGGLHSLYITAGKLVELLQGSVEPEAPDEPVQPLSDFEERAG